MNSIAIPSGWKLVHLDNVAKIQTGLAKGKKNIKDIVRLPYLRVANVQDGHLDLSEIKSIDVAKSEVERYLLKVGDVLLTEGGDNDKLGRGTVWRGEISNCLHQNHIFAVRTSSEVLDPLYLSLLTNSPYGKMYFRKSAKQSTNLASINTKQLRAFPVLLPSISEQRKIVEILSVWEDTIARTKSLIDILQARKTGYMHCLLTGETRIPKYNDKWYKAPIKQILSSRNEKGTQSQGFELFSLTIENGVTPKTERYNREFLVRSDDKKYKKVYPNDIVYNPSNLRWGAIGKSRQDQIVLVSPIYEVLQITDSENFNVDFIFYTLSNPNQIQRFSQLGEGTLIERIAVKLDAFLTSKILVPSSLDEQIQIANVLKLCDQELEMLQRKLLLLNRQKIGLMQYLLTGKLRVKV